MKTNSVDPFKGNYSLEPREREELFDKFRGEAWPEGYKKYRENWSDYPNRKFVSDYPLNLDIELSTACNLNCPMCYTILPDFQKSVPVKFLDFDLYKKIIDEIGGKVPAVRLSFRGESTLHPNFVEAIAYAKAKGVMEVSTLTNGSTLTEDFFTKMMLAGIDWITISVDGLGETYEKIRSPLKFDQIYNAVAMTKAVKTKYGMHRPVIKIQPIWSSIKDDVEAFYNTFAPISDLIMFNPDVDFEQSNKSINNLDSTICYVEDFICASIYQRFFVCSDGRAIACCYDMNSNCVIGDAYKQSIHDIWHGKPMNKIRDILNEADGFKKMPICRGCIAPRTLAEEESAIVNGRLISVHSYL